MIYYIFFNILHRLFVFFDTLDQCMAWNFTIRFCQCFFVNFFIIYNFYIFFTKRLFGFLSYFFCTNIMWISVDFVDNSVYNFIYRILRYFSLWISCEHIKKWLSCHNHIPTSFCAICMITFWCPINLCSSQPPKRTLFAI